MSVRLGQQTLKFVDVLLEVWSTFQATKQASMQQVRQIHNFILNVQQTAAASARIAFVDAVADQMLRVAEEFAESEAETSDDPMEENSNV